MGEKSRIYYRLTSRATVEIGIAFLLLLYPFCFLLFQKNLGSLAMFFSALYVAYYFRRQVLVKYQFVWISTFLIFSFSFFKGWQQGFSAIDMAKEFYYYAKSLLFFLLGIHSIRFFRYSKYFKWLLVFLLLGTIFFYAFPTHFIGASHDKSHIGSGWGHFLSFGFFLRSGSFLLSPLETAFFSGFLGIYFVYYQKTIRLGWEYFLLASACLVLSMTRSVIMAYGLVVLFIYLTRKWESSGWKMNWIFPFLIGFFFIVLGWFSRDYLIKSDGSFMLHFENLNAVLNYLIKNPWGYGMSSSGYVSVIAKRDAMYSEGSFFTTLIECGVQSLILFLLLGIYCFRKGLFSLSLFLFYFSISLVLPIGFSTPFCFLFFGTLGALSHLNENSNSHH